MQDEKLAEELDIALSLVQSAISVTSGVKQGALPSKGYVSSAQWRELPFGQKIGLFVEELSDEIIMSTTCDVVSHCLDSLCSKKATEESITYCEKALNIIRNKKDNFDLINAGDIAGKAIEITGTNLLHSLSYPLTGYYGVSHGMALGYFLPKILKFIDYDVSDIIEDFNLELDVDIDFIIDEALKYDKINEFKIFISKEILQEVLK